MTSFIYPFPTATGFVFRPAELPADYIGPRLDCPLPLPGDDRPYVSKWDGAIQTEMGEQLESIFAELVPILSSWTSTTTGPQPVEPGPKSASIPPFTPNLSTCCSITKPGTPGTTVPEYPGNEPTPVPLGDAMEFYGGLVLGLVFIVLGSRLAGWFEAQKGDCGWAPDT